MNLYLSTRSPLNSTYSNEDGQVFYRVETPLGFKRTATISRVVPNDIPREGEGAEQDMRDRYAFMGSIEFNIFSPSRIRLVGTEFTTKNYLKKEGWGIYGRHRAFTGPGGKRYKWLLKATHSELIVNDETKALVAEFHTKSFGIIGKARPACLEILPMGEHMIDMILVTFIYIEKKRKDKERSARASDGSGVNGGNRNECSTRQCAYCRLRRTSPHALTD